MIFLIKAGMVRVAVNYTPQALKPYIYAKFILMIMRSLNKTIQLRIHLRKQNEFSKKLFHENHFVYQINARFSFQFYQIYSGWNYSMISIPALPIEPVSSGV